MGKMRLDMIDEYGIAKFKAKQIEKGLKPASINNHVIYLRAMLGKAHEWKKIAVIPRVKKLRNPLKPIRFLSFEETERLEGAARTSRDSHEWGTAVILALNTGMRLGELIALQWDDIDFTARNLSVCRSDWQGHVNAPKSGKTRNIPLNDKAIATLKSHRHLRGPLVFSKEDGTRRSHGEFALALRRIRKAAGL